LGAHDAAPGPVPTRLLQNLKEAPATTLTAGVQITQAHKTTTTSFYSQSTASFIPARSSLPGFRRPSRTGRPSA